MIAVTEALVPKCMRLKHLATISDAPWSYPNSFSQFDRRCASLVYTLASLGGRAAPGGMPRPVQRRPSIDGKAASPTRTREQIATGPTQIARAKKRVKMLQEKDRQRQEKLKAQLEE